ncbi:MAG: tyrosine-type recombinase/integrase [Janthinobacterium lividum]
MSKPPNPAGASGTPPAHQRRAQRLADAYLVAADAPATVRAYTADWRQFASWCKARQVSAMPVTPELVGEYLAELGEGYAKATLRRKVAAIARAARIAGMPLDTRHPSIRDVLRGIGRTHGSPARRAQVLTTDEVQRLVDTCGDDFVGLRDRALLLLTFAGALRRSELCAVEVEHLHWKPRSLELLILRSKTDPEAEGDRIAIPRGRVEATCPVRALQAWLQAAGIEDGPVFRGVTRHNSIRTGALSGEGMRLIVVKRAGLAGIKATRLEPISPHGLRAGFVTSAYRNGVPDEEIMGHSRHRSLTVMRSYVRRSKLSHASPAGKVGL